MSNITRFTKNDLSELSKLIKCGLCHSLSLFLKKKDYSSYGKNYMFNVCKEICSSITYNQFIYYFNQNYFVLDETTFDRTSETESSSSECQSIGPMEVCDDHKSHSDQLSETDPHSCIVLTLQSSPKPQGRQKNYKVQQVSK